MTSSAVAWGKVTLTEYGRKVWTDRLLICLEEEINTFTAALSFECILRVFPLSFTAGLPPGRHLDHYPSLPPGYQNTSTPHSATSPMHPAMQAATQPYTQAPQPYQQVRDQKSEPPADHQLLLLLLNVLFVGLLILFLRNDLPCQLCHLVPFHRVHVQNVSLPVLCENFRSPLSSAKQTCAHF